MKNNINVKNIKKKIAKLQNKLNLSKTMIEDIISYFKRRKSFKVRKTVKFYNARFL